MLDEDTREIDILSDSFVDLIVNEQSPDAIDLYPDSLKKRAEAGVLFVKVETKTFKLQHIYDGMKAASYKLFEGFPSANVIYCANCKTPLYAKMGSDLYVIPNILCGEDEIPKTWPMKADSPECVKYSKKFDLLYYDEEFGYKDFISAGSDPLKQGSICSNKNLNNNNNNNNTNANTSSINNNMSGVGAMNGSLTTGSLAVMISAFGTGASSAISAIVMKSMKKVKDNYINSLKKDIQKRCDRLTVKLDKNLNELLMDSNEAMESIIYNARMNSEREENNEVCPLYTEISSSSSSLPLQTPVLSGCTMSDEGILSMTPEGFNTVEKPHGLPGRAPDTEAKLKIAKMESYIRSNFDLKQKGLE